MVMTQAVRVSKADRLAQLRQFLASELQRLAVGEALLPMRDLQERSGAKRAMLEQVLEEFESRGLIQRRPRSGIYKTGGAVLSTRPQLTSVDLVVCESVGYSVVGAWYASFLLSMLPNMAADRGIHLRMHQMVREAPILRYCDLARTLAGNSCMLLYAHMPDLATLFADYCSAVVSIYARHPQRNAMDIRVDPVRFVACALDPLHERGHRRIAYLDTVKPLPEVVNHEILLRRESYYRWMAEHGLQVAPHWVVPADGQAANIQRAMEVMFGQTPLPTAVVVADAHLPAVYRYIESRGWKVGRDVSVMGTDDLLLSQEVIPPASTVHNPRQEMIRRGFDLLEIMLQGPAEPQSVVLEPYVVLRESIGPVGRSVLE